MGIFQHLDPLARRVYECVDRGLRETPVVDLGCRSHMTFKNYVDTIYHISPGYAMSEQWLCVVHHSCSPSCHPNLEWELKHLRGPVTVGNQVAQ